MQNILERYGIKEVADVTFIDIETKVPVLYLDTLKVSTIETTAEQTEARGGKGNSPLIIWDYGKEITLTLQDALYSPKSMAMIYGDVDGANTSDTAAITKYARYVVTGTGITTAAGITEVKVPKTESATGKVTVCQVFDPVTETAVSSTAKVSEGDVYLVSYQVTPKSKTIIEISANTFPSTYKIVGDTYARDQKTGKDQFFQFVIAQAKMSAETTLTLEAEGDPTVFDMTLRVLRPDDGVMMQLIQYTI